MVELTKFQTRSNEYMKMKQNMLTYWTSEHLMVSVGHLANEETLFTESLNNISGEKINTLFSSEVYFIRSFPLTNRWYIENSLICYIWESMV